MAGDDELARIRAAYSDRDQAPTAPGYSWADRSYRLYMQQLEEAVLAELAHAGRGLAGARVLEVGCGSGYFLARMLDYGAQRASGIDLMEARVEAARERHPHLEVVAGDASSMPYEDASFDVVTQFTCLSSVLDPELRRDIAADMWRVLAPGGAILSYDMRRPSAPMRALARLRDALVARRSAGAPPAPVTPTVPIELDELRALFPGGRLRARSVGLPPEVSAVLGGHRWATELAATVPFIRTHLVAVVVKDR